VVLLWICTTLRCRAWPILAEPLSVVLFHFRNSWAGESYGGSAPLGPICCAAPQAAVPTPAPTTAPQAAPKAPTASIRSKALRRRGRLVLGRVTCESRCSVRLKVSGGGCQAVQRTLTVFGTHKLTIPVRRGNLTVRVSVDGKTIATGRSTYRTGR
jgi:hypothetical protein